MVKGGGPYSKKDEDDEEPPLPYIEVIRLALQKYMPSYEPARTGPPPIGEVKGSMAPMTEREKLEIIRKKMEEAEKQRLRAVGGTQAMESPKE